MGSVLCDSPGIDSTCGACAAEQRLLGAQADVNMSGPQVPLDAAEWEMVVGKMLKYHDNISKEIGAMVIKIRSEMAPDLVPVAEERATYGKTVKKTIRDMWALDYEIEDIQKEFIKMVGGIDINNLTDDFVEDVMLQSKPLQGILMGIRNRQKVLMEEVKKDYNEKITALEPLSIKRPPKPEPKPEAPKPVAEEKKEEAAPAPTEPAPAVDAAAAPAPVAASA